MPRRARDQQIKRANALPRRDHGTPFGDVSAAPANALPRYRFRQRLHERTGLIQQVGIDHAVASRRKGFAGFDPDRGKGQRQRRI